MKPWPGPVSSVWISGCTLDFGPYGSGICVVQYIRILRALSLAVHELMGVGFIPVFDWIPFLWPNALFGRAPLREWRCASTRSWAWELDGGERSPRPGRFGLWEGPGCPADGGLGGPQIRCLFNDAV
jgi:hypothetical protein